ncbi:aminoglycoside phosphotransferase family protein [Streptomyces sp. NBC_00893]|uniref:aminoglycoside phosphotransferase family protein n=1 Tax=Streptomyces sp. NBC_00893 TaxID=2975862 RepID=UPI0022519CE8|nr:aminoglycoside phosphotransferase family protein [Streptomyces sp. NBC_00893]MCX4851706.1 aminoglycoside phosphotransferase family protein [Streptomyces sp. NBC_00893]
MESVTARLVRRFGPRVAEWCAGTPDLVARLTSRWRLSLGGPLPDGASSVTLRCRWPDGTPAVLKIGPERALPAEQARMLGWFAASGRVPSVLAVDEEAGAMVPEEIVPGTPAENMPAASLPEQWSKLLAALHGVPSPSAPTRVLRGRCKEAFARVGRRLSEPAIGARMDVATWDRAVQRCERLLDTKTATVLLDGTRLQAWSRVIAPFAAIAHLDGGGEGPVIDELLALSR